MKGGKVRSDLLPPALFSSSQQWRGRGGMCTLKWKNFHKRLRELLPVARRSKETGFTQPLVQKYALLSRLCTCVHASEMAEVNSQLFLSTEFKLRLTRAAANQTSVTYSAAKIGPISDVIYCSPSLVSAVSQLVKSGTADWVSFRTGKPLQQLRGKLHVHDGKATIWYPPYSRWYQFQM